MKLGVMSRLIVAGGIAAVAASSGDATIFTFNLTGADTATFTLDSTKTSTSYDDLFQVTVSGVFNGVSGTSLAYLYSAGDGGGIELHGAGGDIYTAGPALYSGSSYSPVITPGQYSLRGYVDNALRYALTITAPSAAAVPEPAGWAMMVGGFGLLGATLRRRKAAARLA